jgi:hypothetical protein
MWSIGISFYWEMQNVAKGRRHQNFFKKWKGNLCNQALLFLCPRWLTAWTGVITLEEGRCIYEDIFESG